MFTNILCYSFQDKLTFNYGTTSLSNNNEISEKITSKKVIFCVHGKLSGCCTLIKDTNGEECTSINYIQNSTNC
jgi:hypothetical protein